MKKLIAIAVVFALVAGVAFAQDENGIVKPGITISGSAEAWFVPFRIGGPVYDGAGSIKKEGHFAGLNADGNAAWVPGESKGDLFTGIGGFKTQVNVTGTSDYAGFALNFKATNNGIERDGANFWVKPFANDLLKFNFWRTDGDMGMKNGGNFDAIGGDFILGDYKAENALQGYTDRGIQIFSKPIPDLQIGLAISGRVTDDDIIWPAATVDDGGGVKDAYKWVAANVWRGMQVGVGYAIPNIGLARVGYFGGWAGSVNLNSPTDDQFNNLMKGTAGLTAIQNLATRLDTAATSLDALLLMAAGDADLEAAAYTWATSEILRVTTLAGNVTYNTMMTAGKPGQRAFLTGGFYLNKLVPGLEVDFGVKLFLPMTVKGNTAFADPADNFEFTVKGDGGVNLGLGVKYANGPFAVSLSVSALQLGRGYTYTLSGVGYSAEKKVTFPIQSAIYLNPTYKISDITLGLHFGIAMEGESKTTDKVTLTGALPLELEYTSETSTIQFDFGVYANKPFGKATLQAGVALLTPKMWTAGEVKAPITNSRYYISVPLKFSMSF